MKVERGGGGVEWHAAKGTVEPFRVILLYWYLVIGLLLLIIEHEQYVHATADGGGADLLLESLICSTVSCFKS